MELKLDEGRVYGARYYTVQPVFHAHPQTWFKAEWDEIENWCETSYGPTPKDGVWTPGARWYMNNSKFWFRNESDRTMFVIKWQ
jgi:hypothetical protein